jgi:dipeptidase E
LDKFDLDLSAFDVLYMAGGNTFHIMDKIKKLGLFEKIKEIVNNGKIYFGVSAGSIMAGPNIGIASPWDENDINLTDYTGFNFVNFAVSPHYTEEEIDLIRNRQKRIKYSSEIVNR